MPVPKVKIFASAEQALEAARGEVVRCVASRPDALVSFATGRTYASFFGMLSRAFAAGLLAGEGFRATHLDEYEGFDVERSGGMAREILDGCPQLRKMREQGRFLTVPHEEEGIPRHERGLEVAGGVELQLLGLGRNGHLAFNEPGTDWSLGFHRARLSASTRADARAAFAPAEPPSFAITAGPRSILAGRRLLLVATGAAKAPAVRAMLHGPIGPACPATLLREHRDAIVLLDREAAALLEHAAMASACS